MPLKDIQDLIDGLPEPEPTEDVDELIAKSARALDALLMLYADLVTKHGRNEGFGRLTQHLLLSSVSSVEGAVGIAGLLAVMLAKEQDRRDAVNRAVGSPPSDNPKSFFVNLTMCSCGQNQRCDPNPLADNLFLPHDDAKTGEQCPGFPINR